MTCGIYMIQNKVNGKIYIGQAVDIEKRWKDHKKCLRNNRHHNEHLQNTWNKYGEDNFEFTIICECEENQLNTMEEYYIFELMSYDSDFGYNKSYGGGSGRPTEEARKKQSEAIKGKNNYMYGKHHTEETKKKMSEARKGKYIGENSPFYGKPKSEEHRKHLSESRKGKYAGENHPWYGRHHTEESIEKMRVVKKGKYDGENNPFYGKHHTEETRRKISETKRGKYTGENSPWYGKHLPEETRRKISESLKGKGIGEKNPNYGNRGFLNPNSIPIVQLTLDGELVKVYGSTMEAKRNGFDSSAILKCIKGIYKQHKGYKWMRLANYEAMKKEGLEK